MRRRSGHGPRPLVFRVGAQRRHALGHRPWRCPGFGGTAKATDPVGTATRDRPFPPAHLAGRTDTVLAKTPVLLNQQEGKEMDATQATVMAAVATLLSAGVIAWQAVEIRRTAKATEKTLRVAQDSLSTSKDLAVEALRARLDARGQAVRVHVAQPAWPPLEPSLSGGEPQPVPLVTTYRMSGESDRPLMLRADLEIVNEGDRVATVNLHPPLRPDGESGPCPPNGYERVVARGGRLQARLEEARPVSEWVQNWRDGQEGRPPSVIIVAEIVCSDGFDEGVVDRWRIELTGHPIRPIPGDDSGWELNRQLGSANSPLSSTAPPHERMYFLSKSANHRV